MASIFTYDPDPPRVASPWLTPIESKTPSPSPTLRLRSNRSSQMNIPGTPPPGLLTDYNVTKLEPEPQEGPIEFKLHLLLRPRRVYTTTSTGTRVAGSQQAGNQPQGGAFRSSAPVQAPSSQNRQNRLEQLTTQLLWRLQQSSPFHASSASDLVVPQLPESETALTAPIRSGKLLAGLEGSRGALYEIGVSDDGTFVGLTEDEMEESLVNLRAMAASLGCLVDVTKMVMVGDCEWHQAGAESSQLSQHEEMAAGIHRSSLRHQAQLWVAEALITPDLTQRVAPKPSAIVNEPGDLPIVSPANSKPSAGTEKSLLDVSGVETEQLRITLTGASTSGKSSLLGTLSTATLDNGRGSSRMSLLRHRHELVSGQTSSVAQELFGYRSSRSQDTPVGVVNYAAGNVSSWNDIHAIAESGRLVYVSDSPGHPKHRRTTVRGIVGWAPHWTLLCVAADDDDKVTSNVGGTATAQDVLGSDGAGVDLSKAHLDLCLKLDKPLMIVITKLDLARTSLRPNLAKILTALKDAGRVPVMLAPDQSKGITVSDLASIPITDLIAARNAVEKIDYSDLSRVVPIVMTSSVTGAGVRLLHALLHALPIPAMPTARDYVSDALNPEQPACLFHVEDVFGLPASVSMQTSSTATSLEAGVVVAGYVRFGSLAVGDVVVIGPFPADLDEETTSGTCSLLSFSGKPFERHGLSRSAPSTYDLRKVSNRNQYATSKSTGEWHNAHIVSIRNLRLPVHRLEAGQVGSIGIVFDIPEEEVSNGPFERLPPCPPRIRKGMVLAIPSQHMLKTGHTLQAASCFTASFEDSNVNSITLGSLVVIYTASVRASARVVKLSPHIPLYDSPPASPSTSPNTSDTDDEIFKLNDDGGGRWRAGRAGGGRPSVFGKDGVTDVTLELLTNREWIELGSQVLIMPGGGPGIHVGSARGEKGVASLEGFVGRVVEVVG